MSKTIALVGHCGADASHLHIAIRKAVPEAKVVRADDDHELKQAISIGVDLVLLNRELNYGFLETSGVELMNRMRKNAVKTKFMLVSNYPDAQVAAVANGALPGFGKRELGSPRVADLIRAALQS